MLGLDELIPSIGHRCVAQSSCSPLQLSLGYIPLMISNICEKSLSKACNSIAFMYGYRTKSTSIYLLIKNNFSQVYKEILFI